MLQRIQTVFLIIVVLAMGGTLLFPIWVKANLETGELHQISAFYYKSIASGEAGTAYSYAYLPYVIVAVLAVASMTVGIIEITKFKNRLLQMKFGALNAILMAGALGMIVWLSTTAQKEVMPELIGEYKVGFFLPMIAMVCNLMANRAIRRDEKLVKSVDRIR